MTSKITLLFNRSLKALATCWFMFIMMCIAMPAMSQNVFSGEPVQWVGTPNGFSTEPYNSDYRTTSYRKVSTTATDPSDGRGQWATTINVQSSGGNIAPANLTGGGGSGWLLISGPSGNRFQNKWAFGGIAQASVNQVNNATKEGSTDMGINMSTPGRYTFVMRDAGYTNTEFYVGYTANAPVTVSRTGQSFNPLTFGSVISISTSATPSAGENVYVRYRVGTNNFTSSTSVVQATGSGTSWSAEIPQQTCGVTVFYYVYTSTRTLSQIIAHSEQDRSTATLRYDDNSGNNYSYNVAPVPTAGITNNTGSTELTCATTQISVTATGGVAYSWNNGLGSGASKNITAPNNYTVTVTADNGCTAQSSINITQNITAPTAGITNNSGSTVLTCALTSISVTATGGVSYEWDNELGNDANASISSPGTYTVTVTGANGCTSEAQIEVTQDVAEPTAGITNNSNATELTCSQTSISVTATGGVSYAWDNGLGNNANASITSPGTYTVTVTGANGCTSEAQIVITQNLSLPSTPVVSGFTNVCPFLGNNVQVTYTATSINASSFVWTLPPNVNLISQTNNPGVGTITVTFNNAFGTQVNKQLRVRAVNSCGNTPLSIYYLLAQYPSTPAPIVASTTNVCPSLGTEVPITFTIPKVTAATAYVWAAQNGTTTITSVHGAGENDTTVTVTFTSGFTTSAITVYAVNSCGISGTRSITITRSNPSTPSPISGPTNVCEFIAPNGTAAAYSVPLQPNVTTYTWTLPPGAINVTGQGTNSVSFIYPAGYAGGSISVVASNGCGSSAVPRSLSVTRLNPAAPSVIDVAQIGVCPNREYTYSLTGLPANATSIAWTVPVGGTILSGDGTSSITVSYGTDAISGVVTATALNNCGNSATRSSVVKLAACPVEDFAKGKAIGQLPVSTEAVELNVFPNPSVNDFRLQVTTASKDQITVRLLDLQGRELKRMIMMPDALKSFGSDLKPGTYMIEVLQGTKRTIQKIIKL